MVMRLKIVKEFATNQKKIKRCCGIYQKVYMSRNLFDMKKQAVLSVLRDRSNAPEFMNLEF